MLPHEEVGDVGLGERVDEQPVEGRRRLGGQPRIDLRVFEQLPVEARGHRPLARVFRAPGGREEQRLRGDGIGVEPAGDGGIGLRRAALREAGVEHPLHVGGVLRPRLRERGDLIVERRGDCCRGSKREQACVHAPARPTRRGR